MLEACRNAACRMHPLTCYYLLKSETPLPSDLHLPWMKNWPGRGLKLWPHQTRKVQHGRQAMSWNVLSKGMKLGINHAPTSRPTQSCPT